MKKLTIFAMTEKGFEVVKAIVSAYPDLVETVIGSRDDHLADDRFEALQKFCVEHAVAFVDRRAATAPKTEFALAVSWRWLIAPGRCRLIVLHDSLLPRYRGFNPLVTALINGDREIGVTALYAVDEYDRGEILAQSVSRIAYPITISEAIVKVTTNYREVALAIAGTLSDGGVPVGFAQDEAAASYSLWRDEEDYFVDWSWPAERIKRFVDAVGCPYESAASIVDGKVLRLIKAEALPDVAVANRTPGKVIFVCDGRPVVTCGSGLLRIDELVDDASGVSVLPLQKFRTRFKGRGAAGVGAGCG
jgi:methionyl-tRNA formyltransferase